MKLYTAKAIKEQMHKLICQDCEESDVCSICDYRELIDEILDAPTVDAEPVIRCKDCKYYYVYYRNNNKHNFCDLDIEMMRDLDPNYYCASAERK
jgi:hypothetical protein